MSDTPGVSDVVNPCARIVPATHIIIYVSSSGSQGLAYLRVAFLLVQVQPLAVLLSVATAEVDLDEVKLQ